MRYSFYKHFSEGLSTFNLHLQNEENGKIRSFEFQSNIEGISDIPGVTRLFGKEIEDLAGNYALFPVRFDNVEVGNFGLIQQDEKFTTLQFSNEEPGTLNGRWILRKLSTGDFLLWKPVPMVFTTPTTDIAIGEDVEKIEEIEQQFAIFEVHGSDGKFSGIGVAEGIWTGKDFHTTLFNKPILNRINKKMNDNMSQMLVDYNHDFVPNGKLTKVTLQEQRGVAFIELEGEGNLPIPPGSGLSLILKSKIKWDKNLNVFVLLEADPLGISIITEGSPACTICMIR